MKKFVSLLLTLALCMGLMSIPAVAQQSEQITLFAADHPDVIDPLRDKLGEFEQQTGIKVKIETVPESERTTKANLILSSESKEYDVFVAASNDLAGEVQAGWYTPIDTLLPEGFDMSDYPETLRNLLTVDGHLYGMPTRAETNILMYRKDIFEEKGISVPTTLDEYEKVAAQLTGNGFYGTAHRGDPGQSAYSWNYFLKAMGGNFLDTNMKAALNSDAAKAALDLYVRLNTKYAPDGAIIYTWDQVFAGMQNGTVGMIIDSSIQAGILEDPNKSTTVGKIGYAVPPAGPAGPHPDLKCYGVYVSAFSEHKEAAMKLAVWMTSADMQKYAFDKYGAAALTSISAMDYANDKAPYFAAIKDAMAVGDIYYLPPIPECGSIYMATCEAVSGALSGTVSVEDALAAANEKIQKSIDEAGYTEIPQFIKDGHG